MDKELYIFDLDGTLLYTLEDIRDCLNDTITSFGYPSVSIEKTKSFIGNGAKNLVKRATGLDDGEKLDEILAAYIAHQRECTNSKTRLYDGLDKVLEKLKRNGKKIAIISNKPDIVTQEVYKKHLSKFNFDYVYGNKPELFKIKPDKECVEYCLNKLNVRKENAVYIGDSEVDVKTAKNADMDLVCVLWGYRDKDVLIKEGCTVFAENAVKLMDLLN